MRTSCQLILFLLLTIAAPAQGVMNFCDLLRNAERFNGKEVTVRATYRYGYEWSQLYCLKCADEGKVWLELPSALDYDNDSQKALRKMPKGSGIVDVTVRGVFTSGATYGHGNMYRSQLRAMKITDVFVIQKGMKSLSAEAKADQRSGCGGSNPP